ncbi:MAG: ribosome-associated translation inhibitor RaiA [Dongiaceae bacterium]|jgi:ribosomal subunit interface protein
MLLTVKGKQIDVGDALRAHAAESLNAVFAKYFGDPVEATVMLSREAHLYRAQISVHVGRGILLQSQADADAPYSAFDAAAEHVAKRLRRYKRRLRDHHRNAVEVESAQHYVLAGAPDDAGAAEDESDGQPVIVAELAMEIPTLSVGEAVMRLDLADGGAIMFRNRAHGGLNMVYRRADGNVGWVDPRGNRAA